MLIIIWHCLRLFRVFKNKKIYCKNVPEKGTFYLLLLKHIDIFQPETRKEDNEKEVFNFIGDFLRCFT